MPGIGGTNGRAPAAMTMARVVSVRVPAAVFTSTVQGEVIFASPCEALHAEPGVALDRIVRLDRPHHALHALHHVGEIEFRACRADAELASRAGSAPAVAPTG